ncbi:proline--tRNA ligase [Paenibacillus pasadenensis]|uniref:proline--tRNA ligase n=1 Tax=Paenibacillus TaxID=44249 RepID=UPI000422285E|nr:proline--tRNA ligase [Paenibacillus pasadenensis]
MRQSRMLLPTLREAPGDAEASSHALMQRAGMIRQLAAGVYSYLPLGRRVLGKIERIIREEMDRAGAQETLLPALQPAELWRQSGRYDVYGPELMRLCDRHDREFALGPTHEEVVTALVGAEVSSYRKLPLALYQIQTKFRDERRPRYGLLRGREFLMKDAYSFDADREGLDRAYGAMLAAYHRIFSRLGLRYRAVEADAGAIGGDGGTHEFMALADIGEDTIVSCSRCEYAANLEKAEARPAAPTAASSLTKGLPAAAAAPSHGAEPSTPAADDFSATDPPSAAAAPIAAAAAPERAATPDARTIAEVSAYLDVPPAGILKTLLFVVGGTPVAVVVRGDHEINELKVLQRLREDGLAREEDALELADAETVLRATGAKPGFAGPVGLDVPLLVDRDVAALASAVAGAGEEGFHLLGVVPGRDFPLERTGSFRNAAEGDGCPRCEEGRLTLSRGIELGHVFKLGTKYSEKLGALYLDKAGKERPIVMGCYGIGVSRALAAAAEQSQDGHGLVWPDALAPFHVHVMAVSAKDEAQQALAERLYDQLSAAGVETLLDDRDERPGVKFKDADLIGIPVRLVVGRDAVNGAVEYVERSGLGKEAVSAEEAVRRVLERFRPS